MGPQSATAATADAQQGTGTPYTDVSRSLDPLGYVVPVPLVTRASALAPATLAALPPTRGLPQSASSQVSPLSGEKAWLQIGCSLSRASHLNITIIGFPLKLSLAKKCPTLFSNEPTTGGSKTPTLLATQYKLHNLVFGLKSRKVRPSKRFPPDRASPSSNRCPYRPCRSRFSRFRPRNRILSSLCSFPVACLVGDYAFSISRPENRSRLGMMSPKQ